MNRLAASLRSVPSRLPHRRLHAARRLRAGARRRRSGHRAGRHRSPLDGRAARRRDDRGQDRTVRQQPLGRPRARQRHELQRRRAADRRSARTRTARRAIDSVREGHDRVRVGAQRAGRRVRSPIGSRSNDTYITSVVKTRFLEAADKFSATHVKVVTDRGVVYLMGIVRRAEIDAAARDRRHDPWRRARRQGRRIPTRAVMTLRAPRSRRRADEALARIRALAAPAGVHERRVRHPASRPRHLPRAGARARREPRRRGQHRRVGAPPRQGRRPPAQRARRPHGRARRARGRRPRRAVRRRHAARSDRRVRSPTCSSRAATTRPRRRPAPRKSIARGGRFVAIPFEHDRSTTALMSQDPQGLMPRSGVWYKSSTHATRS